LGVLTAKDSHPLAVSSESEKLRDAPIPLGEKVGC